MVRLFVTIYNIGDLMTAGYTHVRVYTDSSATGTFTTLDGTITLVADQESYEYVDTSGTSATWYRTCYYSVALGEGDKTAARKGATRVAYGTVLELRERVDITGRSTDVELAGLLDAATTAINNFCNRPDGFIADTTATARYYTGSGLPYQWIDECVEIDAVAVKDSPSDDEDDYTTWTLGTIGSTTDADVFAASGSPERPDFNSTPYTFLVVGSNGDYSSFTSGKFTHRGGFKPSYAVSRGTPTVQVTARWGRSASVPHDIREACLMQGARWLKRFQSAMADTAAGPEFGTLLYRQELDPDIRQILVGGRHIKPAIGRR